MTSKDIAIGIDLGTTYSCVAFWQHGKLNVIADDFYGSRTIPSYVSFSKTERLLGEEARNQVALNPENTVFDAKRLIGRKFEDETIQADMKHWPFSVVNDDEGNPKIRVLFKGEEKIFAPEEISAMVLTKLRKIAENYLGDEVTKAVITVPAHFNDSQRQATKDAGVIAGLNVLRVFNEPTAAALAYGLDNKRQGERNVLVFDLGGGTFDVSVVNIDANSQFEIKAVAGDTHLGGEDFDNRLVNHLVKEFKRNHRKDISENQRALRKLRSQAERAKRALSAGLIAEVSVDSLHEDIDFSTMITRSRFEELCSDLFARTLEPMQNALNDAGLRKEDIDDVVLVGGSTRIPKIRQLLENFFEGKKLSCTINADEAVACGAAIQAAIMNGDQGSALRSVILIDVIPLALGIEVNGGIMSKVIERNTKIPCKRTRTFLTSEDNQKEVEFAVFEGERSMTEYNHHLGSFELTNIPPAPEGKIEMEVTFDLNEDGILNVSAKETSTGNSNSIIIKIEKGRLSNEEIHRMITDAERYELEDEKQRKQTVARNKLEHLIYRLKSVMDSGGDPLNFCVEKFDGILQWLDKIEEL